MNNQLNLLDTTARFNRIAIQENNKYINNKSSGEYKRILPQTYQNDFREFYNYKGQHRGQFRYQNDVSVKSDPMNEYEEGRRTLLTEVANNYGVKVGGFILPNSGVKKYSNNKTPALKIVGVNS